MSSYHRGTLTKRSTKAFHRIVHSRRSKRQQPAPFTSQQADPEGFPCHCL